MNRHTNPFAQGAATGVVLVLLTLSYTLVRPTPATSRAPPGRDHRHGDANDRPSAAGPDRAARASPH